MAVQERFSDALAAVIFVVFLVAPWVNAFTVLVVFAVLLGPAIVYYRSMLVWRDRVAMAVGAAVALGLALLV